MTIPSQSDNLRLPLEVLVDIVEHHLPDDPYTTLKVAQTCRLFRYIALPRFKTLSPVDDADILAALPEHLRPRVRNLWIQDDRLPACEILKTSWIWNTVPNLAVHISTLWVHMAANAARTRSPLACQRLTLLSPDGSHFVDGLDTIRTHFDISMFLSNVTHLQCCVTDLTYSKIQTLTNYVPSITHFALSGVASDDAQFQEPGLPLAAIYVGRGRPAMFVVVRDCPPEPDLDAFIERVRRWMRYSANLYIVVGATSDDDIRADWERVIDGGEDIWQKAKRLRAAIVADDTDTIAQICLGRRTV